MGNNNEMNTDTTTQPFTEENKNNEKIIHNKDNNMFEEINNIDINNINDLQENSNSDNNSDESDDFMKTNFIKKEANKYNNETIYVWIDPDINNKQNKKYYDYLKNAKNIDLKKYDKIDECFNDIIKTKDIKYKEIIIIISGKLFYDFIRRFRDYIKNVHFSPTIIIFTNKKELLISQLKMNDMYYNNDLFDPRLIFTNVSDILDFINNKIIEENDLTFDIIESPEQIIIPNYYKFILEDTFQHEIEYFNSYLIQNYPLNNKNEDIHMLINQIKNKVLPKDILIKYWLRIYTCESDFYGILNKFLRTKNNKVLFYYPFIKLCYEELRKGFLESSNKILYRCSKISIKEFEEIYKKIKYKDNNIEVKIPNVIAFSRSFLSFSMDEKYAKRFAQTNNGDNTYSILYIIEEINHIDNNRSNISNADIENFSFLKREKEILIFPFTCFEILKIVELNENINNKKIDYKIHLKYLGNYSHYIEENFGNKFFDKIQISKFSEELIQSGVIRAHNIISTWVKRKSFSFKININKICFFLDGEEDCVSFSKNEIILFNTKSNKKRIIRFQNEILDIIKLPSNKICSSFNNRTLRIIQFYDNNTKYKIIKTVDINANKILYLYKDLILCLDESDNITNFKKHDTRAEIQSYIKVDLFSEKDKILGVAKLNKEKIVYVTEKNKNEKIIYYLNINYLDAEYEKTENIKKEKEQFSLREDKDKKLKFIDLVLSNDYILICFNSCIDIYSYQNEILNFIKTFDHFDYEITNILFLSSERIILGFYDYERKRSTIREHLLRKSDIENNKNKFDCIGKSEFVSYKIDNIIKIYDYKILIKSIDNSSISIYERKNEVSELLKESLIDICINQEVKYEQIEEMEEFKEIIENQINNIQDINANPKIKISENIKNENHIYNFEQPITNKVQINDKNNNIHLKNNNKDTPMIYNNEFQHNNRNKNNNNKNRNKSMDTC